MEDKIIGFIGSDKYEIILYLSRILYHLGKKVLLVDYSDTEALYQSISVPEALKEESSYIHYSGIDFIQGKYYSENQNGEYDYILVDFGFHNENWLLSQCKKILIVSDLQLHNIRRIQPIILREDSERYLILKDVFPCKIKPDYILEQLRNFNVKEENIYLLYQDPIDIKYRIQSQYDHKFSFSKLSKPTKDFLKDIVLQLYVEISKTQLNKAYRKAERGL